MRIYVLLATLALALSIGSPTLAETVSRHDATEELMQYMEARKALEEAKQRFRFMFEKMRYAETPSGLMNAEEVAIEQKHIRKFFDQLDQEVTWDKVKPAFAAVFEGVFTETEITELLKFFRSPAGKAYLEKFPVLAVRLIEAGQQAYGGILPDLEERGRKVDEDIRREIDELRAKKKN